MLRRNLVSAALIAALAMFLATAGVSQAGKPTVGGPCKQCHQPADNIIRGTLVSVSEKFRTINIAVGSLVWVIKYGDDLELKGAEKLVSIPKEKEIGVTFKGDEKNPYAVSLAVKPPAKVPAEKLVSPDEMARLVAEGPAKGAYVLIDSRPKPRYLEGHIPHAVSLPNDKFDGMKDKVLPTTKDTLIIFYCGGVT